MLAGEQHPVATITAWAMQDEDIRHIWASNLSDSTSDQLLAVIIEQWTVLRGHTLRRTFVEKHKKLVKSKAKGKRSLRKELHRKHDENTTSHDSRNIGTADTSTAYVTTADMDSSTDINSANRQNECLNFPDNHDQETTISTHDWDQFTTDITMHEVDWDQFISIDDYIHS